MTPEHLPSAQPAPTPDTPPAVPAINRGARTRFLPNAKPDGDQVTITRRALLGERRNTDSPTLIRHHRIAGDLPEWDPLPPNEQLVHRPR